MFSNNVILSFTPSSRYNRRLSPIKIPFNCRIKPGLGGGAAEDGDYDEYDSYDSSGSGGRGSAMGGQSLLGNIEEMYKMSVSKGDNVLILESRDESADVAFGDRLTVRTDFETRSFLNLALNKCWISEHPDPTERPGAGEMLLVVNGCPATAAGGEENVVVVGSATDKPKFSFTVTERLARLRRMYVFCVIGLCSPLESLAGGNVNMVRCGFFYNISGFPVKTLIGFLVRRCPTTLHVFRPFRLRHRPPQSCSAATIPSRTSLCPPPPRLLSRRGF
jgi:hypothetical protein